MLEVAADPSCTSADPTEAYLLDGECVKAWVARTMQRAEAELAAALRSDSEFREYLGQRLHQELSRIGALVGIATALDRPMSAGAADAGGGGGMSAAAFRQHIDQGHLLRTCLEVLAWCVRHQLQVRPPTGCHASLPEWVRRLQQRRDRCHLRTLFLDGLVRQLRLDGSYPFPSLHKATSTVFLSGGGRAVDAATVDARLALFTYYLMDVGYVPPPTPPPGSDGARATQHQFAAAAAAAASPPSSSPLDDLCSGGSGGLAAAAAAAWKLDVWVSQYLLDCADPADAANPHLDHACAVLRRCARPEVPFALLEALLALGRPHVALAVHRAQAGSRSSAVVAGTLGAAIEPAADLHQTQLLIELRLRCHLLAEAFAMVHASAAGAAAASGAPAAATPPSGAATAAAAAVSAASQTQKHIKALVAQLLDWALQHNSTDTPWLKQALELPWAPGAEEAAVVDWLDEQLQQGSGAGDHLPLYFLQRGQVTEAVAAYDRWRAALQQLQAGGRLAPERASRAAAVQALMHSEAQLRLPLPQRNMTVVPPSAAGSAPHGGVDGLMQLFSLVQQPGTPSMAAAYEAGRAPPFVRSRLDAVDARAVVTAAAAPAATAGAPPLQQAGQGAAAAAADGMAIDQPEPAATAATTAAAPLPFTTPLAKPQPAPPAVGGAGVAGSSGLFGLGGGGGSFVTPSDPHALASLTQHEFDVAVLGQRPTGGGGTASKAAPRTVKRQRMGAPSSTLF